MESALSEITQLASSRDKTGTSYPNFRASADPVASRDRTDLISSTTTTIPKPTSTLLASPTSLRSLQVDSSPSIPGPHKHSTLLNPNPTASGSPSPTKHTNADSAIKQGLCQPALLRAPGSAPRRRRHPKSARVGDVTSAPSPEPGARDSSSEKQVVGLSACLPRDFGHKERLRHKLGLEALVVEGR